MRRHNSPAVISDGFTWNLRTNHFTKPTCVQSVGSFRGRICSGAFGTYLVAEVFSPQAETPSTYGQLRNPMVNCPWYDQTLVSDDTVSGSKRQQFLYLCFQEPGLRLKHGWCAASLIGHRWYSMGRLCGRIHGHLCWHCSMYELLRNVLDLAKGFWCPLIFHEGNTDQCLLSGQL